MLTGGRGHDRVERLDGRRKCEINGDITTGRQLHRLGRGLITQPHHANQHGARRHSEQDESTIGACQPTLPCSGDDHLRGRQRRIGAGFEHPTANRTISILCADHRRQQPNGYGQYRPPCPSHALLLVKTSTTSTAYPLAGGRLPSACDSRRAAADNESRQSCMPSRSLRHLATSTRAHQQHEEAQRVRHRAKCIPQLHAVPRWVGHVPELRCTSASGCASPRHQTGLPNRQRHQRHP